MPAVSAASIAACASATERVNGFSTNTAFPGGRGARDLLRVQAVRGGEHDRVDRRVTQNRVQIIDPAEAMLAAEISDCGRGAGVCRGEANCIAVPHGVNQIAPPPAETHDGCSNGRVGHAVTDGFEILLIPDADTVMAGLGRLGPAIHDLP